MIDWFVIHVYDETVILCSLAKSQEHVDTALILPFILKGQ